MSLPIQTTQEDVQKIVDYLKTKATGATNTEAKAVLGKYLDPRKVSAYDQWNIIEKDGDKLKLAELGKRLSRASEDGKREIFREIIRRNKAYNSAVEFVYHKGFDQVTNVEIASFWHDHHNDALGSDNETSIKKMAVCFFYVAEAAGLGNLTIGRRGQSTRLDISKSEMGQFIGETGLTKESEDEDVNEEHETEEENIISGPETSSESEKKSKTEAKTHERNITVKPTKIFISHGKNMEIVDQMKTMLELADLDYEVVVESESTAIPVPEKVFNSMRDCTAAVICVSADEIDKKDNGSYGINQNVLIEIGAAFVLYDKKVVLVWDKRIEVPSNLQGLYRCEFEGNELSWTAGMKLMKAVSKFKK